MATCGVICQIWKLNPAVVRLGSGSTKMIVRLSWHELLQQVPLVARKHLWVERIQSDAGTPHGIFFAEQVVEHRVLREEAPRCVIDRRQRYARSPCMHEAKR